MELGGHRTIGQSLLEMGTNTLIWAIVVHKQRWEFIKENKTVRKQELDQESKKTRKKERKHVLDQESVQEKKKKLSFFLIGFFVEFFFSFINSHLRFPSGDVLVNENIFVDEKAICNKLADFWSKNLEFSSERMRVFVQINICKMMKPLREVKKNIFFITFFIF